MSPRRTSRWKRTAPAEVHAGLRLGHRLSELAGSVSPVAVARGVRGRVGGDGRRTVGIGDRNGDSCAVQRCASLVRRAELRAGVAARRIRQGLAVERRQRAGDLLAVIRRAWRCIAEARLGGAALRRRADERRSRVHAHHRQDGRRHGGRGTQCARRCLHREAVVPVAVDRHAECLLGLRDVAADLDVAVVRLHACDVEPRSRQPGLHARDGAVGRSEALEILARLEEMPVLRAARSRDGERELLKLAHAAVRRQVDPRVDGRTRCSVAAIHGVTQPPRPCVRNRLPPGRCLSRAERTGNDCGDAHDQSDDARRCESHKTPFFSPQW